MIDELKIVVYRDLLGIFLLIKLISSNISIVYIPNLHANYNTKQVWIRF